MNVRWSSFIILFVFSLSFAQDDQSKIIGGQNAEADEFLFMAGLADIENGVMNPRNHFCGGSLINEKWVLTAAHCLFDERGRSISPNSFFVFLNTYDLTNPNEDREFHQVERIIIHPNYDNNTLDNDLALIELKTTTNLPNVIIPNQNDESVMENGKAVNVIGWGALDRNERQFPNILQKVEVEIISTTTCNQRDWYDNEISNVMFCAGLEEGGRDACVGDSGGPLFFEQNDEVIQLGIVSWGDICGAAKSPGVYTKINQFSNWIENQIDGSVSVPNYSENNWDITVFGNSNGVVIENLNDIQLDIQILNIFGNKISQTQLLANETMTQTLANGIYIINATDMNGNTYFKKLAIWSSN